ncbi:MAG: hypothetical protein B1H05_00420 [Candidatus Cloacimonas sp. 4484_140]|nr:MAG: hypothetical protein B1H05_00420 [Candidatus Cloacimonas sp. 4484_140]
MAQKKAEKIERFKFGKINKLLFIAAIVAIIIGFIIVNSTTTFGTILLVLGYAVLIPLSLLVRPKKKDTEAQ